MDLVIQQYNSSPGSFFARRLAERSTAVMLTIPVQYLSGDAVFFIDSLSLNQPLVLVITTVLFPTKISSSAIMPVPTDISLDKYNSIDDLTVHLWVKGIDNRCTIVNLTRFRHLVNPNLANGNWFHIFFTLQDVVFSPLNMCISSLSPLHCNYRGDILVVKVDVHGHPSDIYMQEVNTICVLVLKSVPIYLMWPPFSVFAAW